MSKKQNAVRADGLMCVQVYIGTVDGKRKYKTVYGHSQKEVDEKAQDIKIALGKGIDVLSQKDTFGEWSLKLLKIKEHEVSHTRYITVKSALKHLEPIKNIEIGKIKTSDIKSLIFSLSEKLSEKTLLGIKGLVSQTFQLAIDDRIIDYNPATSIKMPKSQILKEINKDSRRALTEEERQWIISTPHRAQTAAMIMLFAGLRRGELIPLTWSDINFEEKTITVNKSVEMINGQSRIKDGGKTANANRKIYVPQILIDYLKTVERKNLLVCLSANGEMLSESAFIRMWNSYILDLNIKYGDFGNCVAGNDAKIVKSKFAPQSKYNPHGVPIVIPRITAHWLRYSFASMLYMAGVDVLTAKEQLGHADIKTTLNIYTHLDNKFKTKSMNKLDEYLNNCSNEKDNTKVE